MKYTELESSLLEGRLIRRKGWNQGDFIFRQVPAKISLEIVPKMQSLPEEAKNEFLKLKEEISTIDYDNQIAFVTNKNSIFGWSPSVEDLFSEDWEFLNN